MTPQEAIEIAANGNQAAQDYLHTIAGAARQLDNMVDQDKPFDGYQLARHLLIELPRNTFYQTHYRTLNDLHMLAVLAWKDADQWLSSSDPYEVEHAKINRDLINEICIYVAQLTNTPEDQRLQMRRALLTRD